MTCPLVQASVITIQIIGLILALHTERTTFSLSTVQPGLLSSLFLSVKLSQLSGQTSGYQSWRTPDWGGSAQWAQWSQSCPDDEQDRREDRTATRQSVWPTSRRNPSQVASTEVIACHLMSHLSPQRKYGGTKLWKIWLRLNQVNTSYPPGWNTIKTNKENKNNWMELVDRRWVVCIS